MPFKIIREDITKMETDAIVNAANNRLIAGGGVCGAIFAAAGAIELARECSKIGCCETGGAVITKGYNLKAKYIIHTVGPIYGRDSKNEERQLYSCYKSSLELARKKRLSSIAFPLISSGIYGYPKTEALRIATGAVKDFLENHEMDIYLVVYDADSFEISKNLFEGVSSFIDEKMIKPDVRRDIEASFSMLNSCDVIEEPAEADETEYCVPGAPAEKVLSLKNKKSLEDLMNIKTETFSQMLLRIIDEKGMTDTEVYKRANIDRKLFSKIRKKDYTPKKVTVTALIIALRLDMREARELLGRAGFAFTNSSKFDIIIEYFIEQGNYDIFEINETLFAFGQKLLGA